MKELRRAQSVFFFLCVTFSILLAVFVVEGDRLFRPTVREQSSNIDFVTLLNPDPKTEVTNFKITDLPQPSFIALYEHDHREEVALLALDNKTNLYTKVTTLSLPMIPSTTGASSLSLVSFDKNAGSLVMIKRKMTSSMDVAFFVAREGENLHLVQKKDKDGSSAFAKFFSGSSLRNTVQLLVQDVNSDGIAEVISQTTNIDERRKNQTIVDVFRWLDGQLVYDKDLSWALAISHNLFPEPAVKATP